MRKEEIILYFFIRILKNRLYVDDIYDEIAIMLTQVTEIADLLNERLDEAWSGLERLMVDGNKSISK